VAKYGTKLQKKNRKVPMNNLLSTISSAQLILLIFIGSAMFFSLWRWLAFRKSENNKQIFSDEEINLITRVNDLFGGFSSCGGHEWKTLPVDSLIKMCVEASEIVGKENIRTKKSYLIQTAEKAEDLSSWMQTKEGCDFYRSSNMLHLTNKPKILACSLRSRAGKI
jgi:hypothetical protein